MNIKEMSNAEIRIEKENIRNDFEATKSNIKRLCDKLEKLQRYYKEIISEEEKRSTF